MEEAGLEATFEAVLAIRHTRQPLAERHVLCCCPQVRAPASTLHILVQKLLQHAVYDLLQQTRAWHVVPLLGLAFIVTF